MENWELAAREQIRELVATYTHLGDSGRIDEMTLLFAAQATLDVDGSTRVGHAEIASFFRGIAAGAAAGPKRTFIRHYISNLTMDVTTESDASGAAYWTVISDVGLESSGRYRDTYRRENGGTWRFASRKIRADRPSLQRTF